MRMRAFVGLGAEVLVQRGELRARLLSPVPVSMKDGSRIDEVQIPVELR